MKYILIFLFFVFFSCKSIQRNKGFFSSSEFNFKNGLEKRKIIAVPIYAPSGEYKKIYSQGTVAGGTEVQIFGSVNSFQSGASVYFDFSNTCPQNENTRVPAESVTFVDSSHLKVITPRGIEATTSILIDNPTGTDNKCIYI